MNSLESSASLQISERFIALLDSLSAIRALSQIELQEHTEEQLIRRALTVLVEHQDLGLCSVFLLYDDELRCVAGTSIDEENVVLTGLGADGGLASREPMRFAVGEGIAGLACQSGQLQYARNCQEDNRFKPFEQDDETNACGCAISVPLMFGGQCLGVLNLSHPIPAYFEPWHQHALNLFACMLSQMLSSHRLMHDLGTAVAQRTAELQDLLDETRELKRRYQELSVIDELTGLHNRRYFFAEAESCLSRALRYQMPVSLMLIDVDHFKRINDSWGHVVGDAVLRRIADALRREARAGDIVARFGGEEFVVLLPNTRAAGADLMAMRMQQRISAMDMGGAVGTLAVTASIGIASVEENLEAQGDVSRLVDTLYSQADTAMYACKKDGRNRHMIFHPGMRGPD